MQRKRKKLLPPPPPPTLQELRIIQERKEAAVYDMTFHDEFSPALRAIGRKYPGFAWQVAQALALGWPEEEIISRIKQENGET